MKNPGCWANVLDDCRGPLTGEHMISVAVWDVLAGRPDNRRGRLSRSVKVGRTDGGPLREKTVRNLTEPILCEHHNGATNDLDTEAGKFARAIEDWYDTNAARFVYPPPFRWNPRINVIDGPLLERWFLKTAINNAHERTLPIGSPNGTPGRPSLELVEMVFGRRPVPREQGAGLFQLSKVIAAHDISEKFTLHYWDHEGTHLAGCIMGFRTFTFGVNFEAIRLNARFFDKVEWLRDSIMMQPPPGLKTNHTNVELRLRWS